MLNKLGADRAPDPIAVVQRAQALGAEGVPAMDQNTRDLVANIELVTAKVTIIQPASGVISLYLQLALAVVFSFLVSSLLFGTLFA